MTDLAAKSSDVQKRSYYQRTLFAISTQFSLRKAETNRDHYGKRQELHAVNQLKQQVAFAKLVNLGATRTELRGIYIWYITQNNTREQH